MKNDKSIAREMLEDFKKANKRIFNILIIVLVLWFITICYLIYILNDIGVEKTYQEVTGIEKIENTNFVNGDNNGQNKTN